MKTDSSEMGFVTYTFSILCIIIVTSIIMNIHRIIPVIFPTMESDEYFIENETSKMFPDEKWKVLHNDLCPLQDVPWFTYKHRKYDILIEKDMFFCKECFSKEEVELLISIHRYNIKELAQRYLRHYKYSKHQLDSVLSKYNRNPQISDFYDEE